MLIGEKVYLRPLQATDMEKTLQWRNDIDNKVSAMAHPFPITKEQELGWYNSILSNIDNSKVYFAICDNTSREMIGYIFLNNIDWINRTCYWGAIIGEKKDTRLGKGKEAVLMIIDYAFTKLNLRKVYANVSADHPAIKTWLECGASLEGTLIKHFRKGHKYIDVKILAWHNRD